MCYGGGPRFGAPRWVHATLPLSGRPPGGLRAWQGGSGLLAKAAIGLEDHLLGGVVEKDRKAAQEAATDLHASGHAADVAETEPAQFDPIRRGLSYLKLFPEP